MPLIIVESPTKARTFNRILKEKEGNYEVFATVGHFRDIDPSKLNINYDNNFEPLYRIDPAKRKVVDRLIELAEAHHGDIILATDEDREGESISYHIAYLLGFISEKWPEFTITKDLKRIVFHEITPKALFEALEHPGTLNINQVKAQQTRQILDKIVGYELSPLLWKKLSKNWLSAGRVQTVGLRLIVEREKEIAKFATEPYYQITGDFALAAPEKPALNAKLIAKNNEPYEIKTKLQLFAGDYEFTKTSIDTNAKDAIMNDLKSDSFSIKDVAITESAKYPPPPFTTSQLQISAYQAFGYPSRLTMKLAQSLYERGLITYHRTDSFNLSASYVFRAKDYIVETYGAEYALEKPRGYRTKSRGAQQAHEAIRPTKVERDPKLAKTEKKLSGELLKLYELIFNRTLATQMAEAKLKNEKIFIHSAKGYEFESDFQQVVFDGFLKLANPEFAASHLTLSQITTTDAVTLTHTDSVENLTKPPYRYNDATLVRALEEKGIGRPSTYASIVSKIVDKQYVAREKRYFVPTPLGAVISDYLSSAFPEIFELGFTAEMEERLDNIAEGQDNLVQVLSDFNTPFQKELAIKKEDLTPLVVKDEVLDEKCPVCGSPITIRYGKFGKFMPCSNYPKCKYVKKDIKYLEGQTCPLDGGRLVSRFSPKLHRRFFGCENYPKCSYTQFTVQRDEKQVEIQRKKAADIAAGIIPAVKPKAKPKAKKKRKVAKKASTAKSKQEASS